MAHGTRSASVLRPSGTLWTFGEDGESTRDTVQCCHCGRHWIWEHGSGRRRGYCAGCDGITCGSPQCDPCVPQELRLENWENRRDTFYRPIVVPVTRSIGRRNA